MKIFAVQFLIFILTLLNLVLAAASTNRIEGNKWLLTELNSTTFVASPDKKQAFIFFDVKSNKINGYNGCNNFFAQYERHDHVLKFGPVAATRRACPETESMIENKFLAALETTNTWQIKDNQLLLLNDTEVLAVFTVNTPSDNLLPDFQSLTISSGVFTSGPVKLNQGEYRAPAAPNSASEVVIKLTDKHVHGTVNNIPVSAVVVVTSLGGSGTFMELALLSRTGQDWSNTDTVVLGDRIRIDSIELQGNRLVVKTTTHGPQDPMCCPTKQATIFFTISENKLVAIDNDLHNMLTGTAWQWIRTRYNNDTVTIPTKPENYTVRFMEQGKLNVKADCNLKGGTYSVTDRQITIQILNSTMEACEPGSLEDQFVRDLTGGAVFFFREGDLYIDIKYDTGTMKFSPFQHN